ncbi:MAG TPA: hypothetical protein VMH28_19345 [Candidatus Acidoferrales bacterium]|nr:hypothetical protein [Candidatus Acidoferrales bacterium]
MFALKPLSRAAVPSALAKAERYRLLNEPWQAESICRDILAIDPRNREAQVTLVLALTDQFPHGIGTQEVMRAAAALADEYDRRYYTGIVHERRALALFRQTDFRSSDTVYALLIHAMAWYEQAESVRPAGNDDALLRWNACARFLDRYRHLKPGEHEQQLEPVLSD